MNQFFLSGNKSGDQGRPIGLVIERLDVGGT